MRRSQVVSLHARLTKDNAGMIGAEQIAALPPGAIVVNCARGGLLDYDAVCDALDSGRLFAAAFYVFPTEPLPPDHRLLRTPGVVLTPHLAGPASRPRTTPRASWPPKPVGTSAASSWPIVSSRRRSHDRDAAQTVRARRHHLAGHLLIRRFREGRDDGRR